MKKSVIVLGLLFALAQNLSFIRAQQQLAYDPKVDESYSFDNFNVRQNGNGGWEPNGQITINWNATSTSLNNIAQNGGPTNYYSSWVNGEPRISVDNTNRWQVWASYNTHQTYLQMSDANNTDVVHIKNLKVGDIVKVEVEGSCSIESENTATEYYQTDDQYGHMAGDDKLNTRGTTLTSGMELRIVNNSNNGVLDIKCNAQYAGIKSVNIEVRHIAPTQISNNNKTFTIVGDGILTDKHSAVSYLNVSIGSDQNLTYVKRYTINNQNYYAATSKNNVDPYNEYSSYSSNPIIPNAGTFYYFYPEVNGTLTFTGIKDNPDNSGGDLYFSYLEGNSYQKLDFNSGALGTFTFNVEKGKRYYVSANGNAQNQHPIFHLISYTFEPDPNAVIYRGPLSKVASHAATEVTNATQGAEGLQTVALKGYLGNITGATLSINNGQLQFTNITYKKTVEFRYTDGGQEKTKNIEANKGGAILVYLNPVVSNGAVTSYDDIFVLTVPYEAVQYEDAKNRTKEIKVWDFYTNPLALGKSTDTNSLLYREMHQPNGKSDWTEAYVNLHNPSEECHVFKNAYDMVGDNADMIAETEGLIFNSVANISCVFNELDVSTQTKFNDRYVGLFNGGKFTIPSLEKGDYIRIKMNRYGSSSNGKPQAVLKVTGATDIVGTPIGNDYSIGGSAPFDTGDKRTPNAEYNFISTGGNFTIEVVDAALFKLYTIEIYKNTGGEYITHNGVLGNGRSFLYVDNDQARKGSIILHYRGKGESIKCLEQTCHTGTYYDNETGQKDIVFEEEARNDSYITTLSFTPQPKTDFGSVKVKIGCMTMNGKYVTDYDYYGVAIGYRETQGYPYTWDFTDLSSKWLYQNENNDMNSEENRSDQHRVWDTDGYHHVGFDGLAGKGATFTPGGQLYAGKKMVEETIGLGMNMSNTDPTYNDGMRLVSGGLELNSKNGQDWWRHRIEIPAVPADAVVYVRVKKLKDDLQTPNHFFAGYSYGSWVRNSNTEQEMPQSLRIFDREVAGDDEEYVYIVPGSAKSASSNITLYLNGVLLKRIAVSEDSKTLNVKGYASESRNRIIDHSLTSYFTGQPVKAYIVKNYDEANHKIGLVEITKPMPAATQKGDPVGTVLHKTDAVYANNDGEVKVYNGGFNLFVPDMHDTEVEDCIGNLMLSFNAGGTGTAYLSATEGEYTNFVLNWQYYKLDSNGNIVSGSTKHDYGEEAFFRIGNNANNGQGAAMKPNSAYIKIDSSKAAGAKISFEFDEFEFDEGTPTEIVDMEAVASEEGSDAYYTLSGVRVSRPTSSGLYIRNGKKVYVK